MSQTNAILTFGGGSLAVLSVLQGIRMMKGGMFSTNFTKSFGLIVIATFGVVLAMSTVSDTAKSAAYGLLGTIGGFLAGSRPTTGGGNSGGGGGQGESVL